MPRQELQGVGRWKAQQGWIPRNLPAGSLVGQPGRKRVQEQERGYETKGGIVFFFRMPDPKTCMYVHIHDLTEEYVCGRISLFPQEI